MPNFREGRLDRLYLQAQSSLLTVPNSSGASTLAVANYAKYISARLNQKVATLVRADNTGSRTGTPGTKSLVTSEWSLEGSLACGATGGATPPHDPVLQSVFGQASTGVTGTGSVTGATNASPIVITQTAHGYTAGDAVYISSVGGNTAANGAWVIANTTTNTYELIGSTGNASYTSGGSVTRVARKYTFASATLPFVMAMFNPTAALKQFLGYGNFAQSAKMEFGGVRHAMFTSSGRGVRVLDQDTFSGLTLAEAGQLTAFPSEPSGTLPSDGGAITAFFGAAIFGGSSVPCIASASLDISTGLDFGDPPCLDETGYNRTTGDERTVGLTVNMIDNDTTGAKAVYAASMSKTQSDVVLRIGNTNPGTVLVYAKNVQWEHDGSDGDKRETKRSFKGRAYGPTNNNDELTVWFF